MNPNASHSHRGTRAGSSRQPKLAADNEPRVSNTLTKTLWLLPLNMWSVMARKCTHDTRRKRRHTCLLFPNNLATTIHSIRLIIGPLQQARGHAGRPVQHASSTFVQPSDRP